MVTNRDGHYVSLSGRLDHDPPADRVPAARRAPGGPPPAHRLDDATQPITPVRGRHRRGTDEAWTPQVPTRGPVAGRHAVPAPARPAAPLPLVRHARHATPGDQDAPPYPLARTGRGPAGRRNGWAEQDEPEDTDDLGVLTPLDEPLDEPEIDPLADTGSLGLGKFNLGTVPASVTPPVTWRRAAWFSVASAAAVLVALIALSTALMGPPRSTETIGLPGVLGRAPYPDGGYGGGVADTRRHTSRDTDDTTGARSTGDDSPAHRGSGRHPRHPGTGSTGDRESGASDAGSGTTTSVPDIAPTAPPQVVIAPTRTEVPLRAQQPVDGHRIAKRTISYYRLVIDDPAAAYQMTDGQGSPAEIAERYAGIRHIQVREVYADPNSARTVNQVTLTMDDGSTRTEQRTLEFTHSDDPRIEADS